MGSTPGYVSDYGFFATKTFVPWIHLKRDHILISSVQDAFFTRELKEGFRPVASPEDDDVIANACESKPFNFATNIKLRDSFWLKGQPYSALHMLGHDKLAEKFEGGSVYQAFLSALSYHRWHTPVSGKIVKAFVVDGTYYSEPLFEGLGDPEKHEIDPANETTSQGFLTAVATRAVIFIEADNPAIGLMAFIGVGMAEVSTCDITVKEGQHVKKGDQLGESPANYDCHPSASLTTARHVPFWWLYTLFDVPKGRQRRGIPPKRPQGQCARAKPGCRGQALDAVEDMRLADGRVRDENALA